MALTARALGAGVRAFIADSEDCSEEEEVNKRCPCGADIFEIAVGFALREAKDDVKWISVGTRCIADGVLGTPRRLENQLRSEPPPASDGVADLRLWAMSGSRHVRTPLNPGGRLQLRGRSAQRAAPVPRVAEPRAALFEWGRAPGSPLIMSKLPKSPAAPRPYGGCAVPPRQLCDGGSSAAPVT